MKPRVVVVGCGGIGGVLAARLTRAGVSVTAVTGNPEIAEAIQKDGYQVTERTGERWTVAPNQAPQASLSPGTAPFDLCLLATKSTTMPEALRGVAPFLAPDAPVVCLQNGLPESHAAQIVGEERVLGGVVAFGATMQAPGVYECTSSGGIQIGKPFAQSPEPAPVVELLSSVLPAQVTQNLTGVRWSKLAINAATSTLGALGGERLWTLLRRRFVRRLVLEIWTELVEVARAAHIQLEKVGGTLDIQMMALNPKDKAATLGSTSLTLKHSVLLAVGLKFRKLRSSMLVALERGRTPEIDFINGEIVRQGARLGVPTPVNARLVEAVHQIARREANTSMEFLRAIFDGLRVAPQMRLSA